MPGARPSRIALLPLDRNWYGSTRHNLEHVYDRVSPGGILTTDDHNPSAGSYGATEQWLEHTGELVFVSAVGPLASPLKPLDR